MAERGLDAIIRGQNCLQLQSIGCWREPWLLTLWKEARIKKNYQVELVRSLGCKYKELSQDRIHWIVIKVSLTSTTRRDVRRRLLCIKKIHSRRASFWAVQKNREKADGNVKAIGSKWKLNLLICDLTIAWR